MAFENLTERLQNVFKNLRGKKKITETDVTEITKEIRVALLKPTLLSQLSRSLLRQSVNELSVLKYQKH